MMTADSCKHFITIVTLLLAVSLGLVPAHVDASVSKSLSGSRPNIILIMTDDQGYGQLGSQGHPWLETPHLDALHAESTAFQRFSCQPNLFAHPCRLAHR